MGECEGGASNPPTDQRRDDSVQRCAVCDDPIDTSDWYPVTKQRDDDGNLHIYPFCSEDCRDGWLAERED